MGLLKIDGNIISLPEVRDALEQARARLPEGDEGTDEFIKLVPFLQYGIPYGELQILLNDPQEDRTYREYDPRDKKYLPVQTSNELFYKYIHNYEKVLEKGYSFVFAGANGSGKSFLAFIIMYSFIHSGCSAYYIHLKRYMQVFNDSSFVRGDSKKLHEHIYSCDFLIIDEIGKESKTSANVVGEFEQLLKHRVANSLPTILITNLGFTEPTKDNPVPSIAGKYGNSICDLFLKGYRMIQFSKDNNYRAKTRAEWQI